MDVIVHIVTGVLAVAFIVVAYLSIRSRRKLRRSFEELGREDERFGDSLTELKNKAEELDLKEDRFLMGSFTESKRLNSGKFNEELNGSQK